MCTHESGCVDFSALLKVHHYLPVYNKNCTFLPLCLPNVVSGNSCFSLFENDLVNRKLMFFFIWKWSSEYGSVKLLENMYYKLRHTVHSSHQCFGEVTWSLVWTKPWAHCPFYSPISWWSHLPNHQFQITGFSVSSRQNVMYTSVTINMSHILPTWKRKNGDLKLVIW